MSSSGMLRGAGLAALVGGVLIPLADIMAFLSRVYAGTSPRGLVFFGLLILLALVSRLEPHRGGLQQDQAPRTQGGRAC